MLHSDEDLGDILFFQEEDEVSNCKLNINQQILERASVDYPGGIVHKGDLVQCRTDQKNQKEHSQGIQQMDSYVYSSEDGYLQHFSKHQRKEDIFYEDEEKDPQNGMMGMSEDRTDEKRQEIYPDGSFKEEQSALFLGPAINRSQSSSNKKKNECLTKNLIQFYFKVIKNYLNRHVKENSSDVKLKKAWTEIMDNYKELKSERAEVRVREKDQSGTLAQEKREGIQKGLKRKDRGNTTTNFSLQDFTRMFRIKVLRKPLSQMFRSRYLSREIAGSGISSRLKKEYLKYVPIFVQGFKKRSLECLH